MRLSLKYRIAVIIFLLEAVMMGVVLWQTLGHSLESTRKQLSSTEQTLLGVVSGVSRAALLTEEYAVLQPYLEELIEDPRVTRVVLTDFSGRVVASSKPGDIGLPIPTQQDSEKRFWRQKVISNATGNIGTLAMEFSNEELIKANQKSRRLGVAIALTGMLIIAVVGILVGFLLTRRLDAVSGAAARLARGELGVRTGISGSDEVGLLGTSFDNMAEAIQRHTDELEDRVKARTEELVLAKEEAENANQVKSDFLSSMSHELRTPLNAILGFSQVLEMSMLDDEKKESVMEIMTAGHHLLDLINDILDLTKIESGNLELHIAPVELLSICQQCASQAESMGRVRQIKLDFDKSACENIFVLADSTRLKQIILNLLSNAVKYNREEGSVKVTCKLLSSDTVRVSVKDTGIGISSDNLNNLFEPFNRLGAEKSSIEGTGIGLSITKNLIERMDGKIGVHSVVGEGSEFWFELPTATEHIAENGANRTSLKLKPQLVQGIVSKLILYIEDDPSNIRLLSAVLKQYPEYRLLVAETGAQGIQLALEHQPDLILLDINLGAESGYDVFEELQSDEQVADIPVIALSANAMPRDIEKTGQMGFHGYITKPFQVEDFFKTINRVLDNRTRKAEHQ